MEQGDRHSGGSKILKRRVKLFRGSGRGRIYLFWGGGRMRGQILTFAMLVCAF